MNAIVPILLLLSLSILSLTLFLENSGAYDAAVGLTAAVATVVVADPQVIKIVTSNTFITDGDGGAHNGSGGLVVEATAAVAVYPLYHHHQCYYLYCHFTW